MTSLPLIVTDIRRETDAIRRVALKHATGAPLPGFAAGAHITLDVPAVGQRKYSLIITDAHTAAAPPTYIIGVRLETAGGGGSRFIHGLKIGDRITAEAPQNNFPLKTNEHPVALIGGGIGITPLIAMAATLKSAHRPFQMVYAARAQSELAFLDDLRALAGDRLLIHTDDNAGRLFDMRGHLASLAADTDVYMCGPKPMLKAGMDAAKSLGWPRGRLAFELFYSVAPAATAAPTAPPPPPPSPNDGTFEVVLKNSGQSLRVPPDKTILDVLLEAGIDAVHDCKRGECGVCNVGVVEGVPDHKDHILSGSERASNKTLQICISRSKTPKLVLDL